LHPIVVIYKRLYTDNLSTQFQVKQLFTLN